MNSLQHMNRSKQEEENNPMLLWLLQNNKLKQLIRMMFQPAACDKYLQEYGEKPESRLSELERMKVHDYAKRFTVQQVVQLKGSGRGNVRHHVNVFIEEFLRRKLRTGVRLSQEDRRAGWMQLTQMYQRPHLYASLGQLGIPGKVQDQIMVDAKRTYLSQDIHADQTEQERKSTEAEMRLRLREVLARFAAYNPYINYCQGMNMVVWFFLEEGFSNQESFFILKRITEDLLPCDYYSSTQSPISYARILFQILHQTHPAVVKSMKHIISQMGGDCGFIITMSFVFQLLMCLYTSSNLNRKIRRIVFDNLMLEGVPALFKAALCYFDALAPHLQRVTQFQTYDKLVSQHLKEFNDEGSLIKKMSTTYINKTILGLLCHKLLKPSDVQRKPQKKECNPKWTMCLQTHQNSVTSGEVPQVFVFKTGQGLKIMDDYIEKLHTQYFKYSKADKSDHLRIGRMSHTCRSTYSSETKTLDEERGTSNESPSNKVVFSGMKQSISSESPPRDKIEEFKEGQVCHLVRSKALKSLELSLEDERTSMLRRSESVQFLRHMIQNESFSNLLEIMEIEEMDNMFKEEIQEQYQ